MGIQSPTHCEAALTARGSELMHCETQTEYPTVIGFIMPHRGRVHRRSVCLDSCVYRHQKPAENTVNGIIGERLKPQKACPIRPRKTHRK